MRDDSQKTAKKRNFSWKCLSPSSTMFAGSIIYYKINILWGNSGPYLSCGAVMHIVWRLSMRELFGTCFVAIAATKNVFQPPLKWKNSKNLSTSMKNPDPIFRGKKQKRIVFNFSFIIWNPFVRPNFDETRLVYLQDVGWIRTEISTNLDQPIDF